MGRPRIHASNAERQAAYRSRKKPAEKVVKATEVVKAIVLSKSSCSAFTPRGTKCKFCGKTHA